MSNPITTIEELRVAARDRRSVFVPGLYPKPRGAAWVLNMSASLVDSMLRRGMMVYEPKHPRRETKAESDLRYAIEALRLIATPNYCGTRIVNINQARVQAGLALATLGIERPRP